MIIAAQIPVAGAGGRTFLSYYRARYYDPSLGRFLSEDPLGLSVDADFYRYVRNRPVDFVDPVGLNAQPRPLPEPGPEPIVIGLEPIAVWFLAGGELQLGAELFQTVKAINSENDTYAQHMQAEGKLNQLLLKRADERQCQYENYKKRCSEPPPPGLGPCAKKIWELQRNIDCRDMRYAWDQKWLPGRHDSDILMLTKGIQRQQKWIDNNCN